MTSAQLTNSILSAVPVQFAGEASATNATVRQIGTSMGVAIIGTVLATTLTSSITANIRADKNIPALAKQAIISNVKNVTVASGRMNAVAGKTPPKIAASVKTDINNGFVTSAKRSLEVALVFIFIGAVSSLLIPPTRRVTQQEMPHRESAAA